MAQRTAPEACLSMADVRAGVDAVDEALVALLAERQAYMDAAARIKTQRGAVRDPARVEQVIKRVLAAGRRAGLSPQIAEPVWRELVERSIQYELAAWERLNAGG